MQDNPLEERKKSLTSQPIPSPPLIKKQHSVITKTDYFVVSKNVLFLLAIIL